MKQWPIILLCLILSGCHSYETRTYDVSVKNDSAGPITLWLTKSGEPFEPGWLSPEDIAIESPHQPAKMISGVVVPAGKTADTGPRVGQFDPSTAAVLRVYSGQLNFDQLLAAPADEKHRIDMRLHPGRSDLVVTGGPEVIEVKEQH
jgi:hypothetical protein